MSTIANIVAGLNLGVVGGITALAWTKPQWWRQQDCVPALAIACLTILATSS